VAQSGLWRHERRYRPVSLFDQEPFLRPDLTIGESAERRLGQGWPKATAKAARSGLDGAEHRAKLDRLGKVIDGCE
jgi:hypothetical protein